MRLRLFIALFFISGAIAAPVVVIDAALEGDSIYGTMTARLDGTKGDELRLYLPANRDRDPAFAGPVEEMGLFADNALGAYPFEGRLEVSRLTVNGEELPDFTVEGVRLTVGTVPEGPLEVSLDFTARVPAFRYHWGRAQEVVVLSGWHPQPWPVDGNGDYLDARELPWGVFPARPADYSVRLVVEDGLNPLGPASVDGTGAYLVEGRGVRGADLVLVKEGRCALNHEVWGGLSVELADLTGDGTGEVRLHFAREVFDRYADWFGQPEGPLTIAAAGLPMWGNELYDGLVLLGDIPSYPLLRLPELAYARQMAGRWFRTGLEVNSREHPLLVDGLGHWAAREGLSSIFGEGRDLLPARVLGFEQEWLARTLVKDMRRSRLDRPASAPADAFAQPETYDAAVRQKTAQALFDWSRRWDTAVLRGAVSDYLEEGRMGRATPELLLESVAVAAGEEPAAELAEALGLDAPTGPFEPTTINPREVEEPGFELRLLPDALEPEAWTLCFIPFPWPDYDDSWRLGAALWGRRGMNLLPMEIWGADDLLLSATSNLEHGDWNLLAQYTTLLNGSGPRLGVAAYSRKDEQGGT
ncbi:MAG TPA: hypothetical protein ENN88_03790, partial [Candidatus Coatesbacteria bacterium]|nr:hypothetical protein [Candidatus Coatesbacteria bacterium]